MHLLNRDHPQLVHVLHPFNCRLRAGTVGPSPPESTLTTMRTETPHAIYLKDYTPPAWLIDTVELHVAIHDGHAEVRARLACRRNPANPQQDMVFDGEELTLVEVGADGTAIAPSRYTVGDESLTLHGPLPDAFTLETLVRIEPDNNTQLSGLYRSKDGYFTQCEAQGFRRITFYPDRPDVMARFTCTIEAIGRFFLPA